MTKAANRLQEPEEVKVEGSDNTFFISKLPATVGQDILLGAMSAISEKDVSKLPKDTRNKLMAHVACKMGDLGVEEAILLDSDNAVNAYCNLFALIQLELKMIEKNFGFLFDGSLQKALATLNLAKITSDTETSDPSSDT